MPAPPLATTGDRAIRRVVVEGYGPPSVLRVVPGMVRAPDAHEVVVRVVAAGVNFIDLLQRTGAYRVGFPFTPGIEGSGVVEQLGAAVAGVAEGDRVAWSGCPGGYATHCVVPAERLVPLPDTVSCTDAAAVLVQGMTAHCLVTDVVALGTGHTCLVHAAAGGVGGLLCQLAALRGATVIGTVSHPDKEPAARAAGAAHVVSYPDAPQRVREITGGHGVEVVYDAVGRDTFHDSLACLRPRGTLVLYGQTSGPVDPVNPQLLNTHGSLYLTKPSLSHYDTTPAQLRHRAGVVFTHLSRGELRPRLHAAYPLHGAAAAHQAIEARASTGKLLLRPSSTIHSG